MFFSGTNVHSKNVIKNMFMCNIEWGYVLFVVGPENRGFLTFVFKNWLIFVWLVWVVSK